MKKKLTLGDFVENPDNPQKVTDKVVIKFPVMSLKPEFAQAIYKGKKDWEFRLKAPPIGKWIFIYESAPVSAITGLVLFCGEIKGIPSNVWELMKRDKNWVTNLPGITKDQFDKYTQSHLFVSALRVMKAERLERKITLKKPPQNWGTFEFVRTADKGGIDDGGDGGSGESLGGVL